MQKALASRANAAVPLTWSRNAHQQPRPAPLCRAGFGGFGKSGGAKGAKPQQAPDAQQPKALDDKACPCGSGQQYKECCQRLHKGALRPAAVTPEMMLRARYSAMALKNAWFLKDSSHPDNPALKGSDTDPSTGVKKHCTYEEDMAVTLRSIKLKGLEILGASPVEDADAIDDVISPATVDYAFTYKRKIDDKGAKLRIEQQQPVVRAVQRATFLRNEGQRWLLLDSVDLPQQQQQQQLEGSGV